MNSLLISCYLGCFRFSSLPSYREFNTQFRYCTHVNADMSKPIWKRSGKNFIFQILFSPLCCCHIFINSVSLNGYVYVVFHCDSCVAAGIPLFLACVHKLIHNIFSDMLRFVWKYPSWIPISGVRLKYFRKRAKQIN